MSSLLSLLSQTAGSSGALTVSSSIIATNQTPLTFSGKPALVQPLPTAPNHHRQRHRRAIRFHLFKSASAPRQTVSVDPANATLSTFASTINNPNLGLTAVVNTAGTILSVSFRNPGTSGNLNIESSILYTTHTTTANLNYTNSSDVRTLANLGITMSTDYDGTISFDATSLTSALNSDFGGVLGFFQNLNSWGQSFTSILNSLGSSSATGVLKLFRHLQQQHRIDPERQHRQEESLISAQQKSLTAELNSANEILQALPSQLDGINQLYSAITGYNQSK